MKARTTGRVIGVVAVIGWVAAVAIRGAAIEQAPVGTPSARVMPQYDKDRNLQLPADYRQWNVAGSSLGLSYADGGAQGHQMFNTTLIEPSAYRHFAETGEFREGTMLALIVQGIGTNATPARQGQFATEVHVVEMAVKDSSRVTEGWHVEHAKRDNVFMQFYQMLSDAAPSKP